MASFFVVGHLKTSGGAARKTVIDALTKASEYAAASEPGVYKYCVAIPREGDGKSVFAIEEYANQQVMDEHMNSGPVAELVQTFSSDPSLFEGENAIYGFPVKMTASISFTRPSVLETRDPVIIFANFEYKPGMASRAVPGWTDLVESAQKSEEGTLSYSVFVDDEKSFIRTIEAYESTEFLYGTHVKSEAIEANQKQNGDMRTGGKEIHRLKMIAGYLFKPSEGAEKNGLSSVL